jgi:hypothetical protein
VGVGATAAKAVILAGLMVAFTITIAFAAPPAQAEDKAFGVGFTLGDPTALSGRMNLSHERAADVGLSFFSRDYVLVYGDYLFKFPGIWSDTERLLDRMTPYMGVGPLLALARKKDHPRGNYFDERDDSVAAGMRVPFGVEWLWDKAPIGIGLEVAPGIVIIPSTTGFLQGGISLRYYF